jgi:hypothetical protein
MVLGGPVLGTKDHDDPALRLPDPLEIEEAGAIANRHQIAP